MKAHRQTFTVTLALSLVLAGCSTGEQAANESAANQSNAASPDSNAVAAAPEGNDETAPGCAAHLRPALDEESLVQAHEEPKPSKAKLEAFRQAAGERFKETADEMCRDGKLEPRLLAMFKTLIIQNGGGATESVIYEDPHEFTGEDLIFQWVFAEDKLGLPDQADVQGALSCWAEPEQQMCADREP
jgi:hypothetical protein